MRRAVLATGLILLAFACGGQSANQTPATPAAEPSPAPASDKSSTRPATESECQSILSRMQGACEGISGTHSAQIDGWCTDVRGRAEGGWVDNECVKHVRYVDYVCFMADPGIGNQMDCEATVEKAPAQ